MYNANYYEVDCCLQVKLLRGWLLLMFNANYYEVDCCLQGKLLRGWLLITMLIIMRLIVDYNANCWEVNCWFPGILSRGWLRYQILYYEFDWLIAGVQGLIRETLCIMKCKRKKIPVTRRQDIKFKALCYEIFNSTFPLGREGGLLREILEFKYYCININLIIVLLLHPPSPSSQIMDYK